MEIYIIDEEYLDLHKKIIISACLTLKSELAFCIHDYFGAITCSQLHLCNRSKRVRWVEVTKKHV